MHDMTAGNLRSAFGGESMAHMRYLAWSAKATEEGFPNVGRLFTAIAAAEQVHATNHFKTMADVGGAFPVTAGGGFGYTTTSENLAGAIEGETFEIHEMYPAYIAVAKDQKERFALKSMYYAVQAEKIHARMYADAKKSVDAGKDIQLGPVHICMTCGHTSAGDKPDRCPICSRDDFVTFA